VLCVVLILVEHVAIYDWLAMMLHIILHYIQFVPQENTEVVFSVLRYFTAIS